MTSLIPVEPDPTPRKTNESAKTAARPNQTQRAFVRRRPKKSCCSHSGRRGRPLAAFPVGCAATRAFAGGRRLRCCVPLATRSLLGSSGSGLRRSSPARGQGCPRTRRRLTDLLRDGTGFHQLKGWLGRPVCPVSGFRARSSRPSARAASRVARRSASAAPRRIRPPLPGPCRRDGGSQLVPGIERGGRGRGVGAEPDPHALRRGALQAARLRSRGGRSSAGNGRPGHPRPRGARSPRRRSRRSARRGGRARARRRASPPRAFPWARRGRLWRPRESPTHARATRSRRRSPRGAYRPGCRATGTSS